MEKEFSQKDVAQKINEKPSVLQDYESGRAIPNPQILGKLERVLGVKLRGTFLPFLSSLSFRWRGCVWSECPSVCVLVGASADEMVDFVGANIGEKLGGPKK